MINVVLIIDDYSSLEWDSASNNSFELELLASAINGLVIICSLEQGIASVTASQQRELTADSNMLWLERNSTE